MPGKHNKPMMAHKDKPMMGHKPKMAHGNKPKMSMDVSKATEKQKKMFQAIIDNNRAKMAMPKKNTPSNFPQMAQDMADVLVQKMDGAKMYKPTKYHDMPKMAHGDKPKMAHGDKPKMYGKKKK
jgi:hypothetical protein